jgi:hypothetical protein
MGICQAFFPREPGWRGSAHRRNSVRANKARCRVIGRVELTSGGISLRSVSTSRRNARERKKRGAWQIHTRLFLQMIQFVVYLRDHLLLESFLDIPIINPITQLFNRDLNLKSAFALPNCFGRAVHSTARGDPFFAQQSVGLFRRACQAAEGVFRLIIRRWHRQQVVPHDLDSRWTSALSSTEFLRLLGQLVRTAP